MHSSRMRTARALTVSGGGLGGGVDAEKNCKKKMQKKNWGGKLSPRGCT